MPAGVEAVVAMVRTEVPVAPVPRAVKGTGLTLNEVVRPVAGVAVDAVSVTLPANMLILFNVMVDIAELPATKLAGLAALAEMPKSGTVANVTLMGSWTS